MDSIAKYSDLIKSIPVYNQSTKIKKNVWGKFLNSDNARIEETVFGNKEEVELSRKDVFSEANPDIKIVKTLMWGYPTGGRGKNIEKTLIEINKVAQLLSSVDNADLTRVQADDLINQLDDIKGLGISTWTKLMYFFNISIESVKCQIYDLKIVDSLNKKQFNELGSQTWEHTRKHYYKYIELVGNLARQMGVLPEQVELFLFYYNLDYKF